MPAMILFGDSHGTARIRVYADLIASGVLPSPQPTAHETVLDYIERVGSLFAEQHPAIPFNLDFAPDTVPEAGGMRTSKRPKVDDAVLLTVSPEIPLRATFIEPFDSALGKLDRMLPGRVMARIDRAGDHVLNVMSPGAAWNLAEVVRYISDIREWFWYQAENAESEQPPDDPKRPFTTVSIRRYLRDNGIITPGQLRHMLGRHHVRAYFERKPPSRVDLLKQLEKLPEARARIEAILSACDTMRRASRSLKKLRAQEAARYEELEDQTHLPVLFFEVGNEHADDYVVRDIFGELEQDMMNNGTEFAPTAFLTLRPDDHPGRAFQRLFTTIEKASTAINTIQSAIRSFKDLEEKA